MDKIQSDAVRFLNSIIEVASTMKSKIETEDQAITSDNLIDIQRIDDLLDDLHFDVFES